MRRRISRPVFAIFMATVLASSTQAQGLEPERGVFGGLGAPDPYELALRDALLGAHSYRQCQLLAAPSFETEYAVYFVREKDDSATVVSRAFASQLWARLTTELERASKEPGSFRLDAASKRAALRRMRMPPVQMRRAHLDAGTAALLSGICRDVLLQVRYPKQPSAGLDGTSYHAAHWEPGLVLSGTTWSPEDDTLAGEFVAMELALKGFADAPEAMREARKLELLERAKRVAKRLADGGVHAPHPRLGGSE